MLGRKDLTEDQEKAIDRLFNFNETFLIAPTGSGKTAIVLTAISELFEAGVLNSVLIVAPLKVCLTTWANEAQKWEHLKHLRIGLAIGTPKERAEVMRASAEITIVNEENVVWFFKHYGSDTLLDGIVIDETSRWSQSGGTRFKKIRHRMKSFSWRVGMTAEPVSEDWVRLFGQILLLDLGKSLGKSKDRYLRKYFYPTDWEQRNWEVFSDQAPVIAEKIRGLIHVMPDYKADTLPPKNVTIHPIELPPEAWRRYNRMRLDSVLEVEGETIEAKSRAVLSGKLEQIAAGFSYLDDEEETVGRFRDHVLHHFQKLDWACERVSEILYAEESVIVVYWYQAELEALRRVFPNALEINGSQKNIRIAMRKWRAYPGQLMLLQPSSASHGVDGLQDQCFRQLWLGPIWSKDRTNQAEDRLWRRGQTHAVEIEVCVAVGTIDEIKRASVENKGDHHELFLEHLAPESSEIAGQVGESPVV